MWLQTSLSVSVWYIKDQLGVQISVDVFSICTLNSGLPLNCSNVTSVEKVEILDPRPGQAGAWPPQQPIRGDAGSWKQRPAFRRGTGNENNEPPSRHVNHVWQADSKRKATLITALSANQAFTLVGTLVHKFSLLIPNHSLSLTVNYQKW